MQAKTRFFSVAQELLLAASGIAISQANANPLDVLNKLLDGDEYLRYQLPTSAGGTLQLLDSSTLRVIGVSTFDKAKLPAKTKMILEKIRFAVASVTTTGMTAGVSNQAYSTKQVDCPVPLRGAHFIIVQGGVTKLEIPVVRMLNLGITDGLVGDDAYVLETPIQLEGEVELQLNIRFPDASAAAAWDSSKTTFVEARLIGPQARTK